MNTVKYNSFNEVSVNHTNNRNYNTSISYSNVLPFPLTATVNKIDDENHHHKLDKELEKDNHLYCDMMNVNNSKELAQQYQSICQLHKRDLKWVLMINPDYDCLNELAIKSKINTSNVLTVKEKQQKVNVRHLIKVLTKQTCAAIVIEKSSLTTNEIEIIRWYANRMKTPCVFITKNT